MMQLVFLGTSCAQPTATRGLSCLCIERDGEIIMFDAGEGAQTAFLRASLGWNKKMKILITHLHGDHCLGLPGLLQTMAMQKRTRKIEIYGPPGMDRFIYGVMEALNFGLSFPVFIEAVQEGTIIQEKRYSVNAARAAHSVTAFSYRLDEAKRPGRFHRERATRLGVPEGPLWKRLQDGHSIQLGGNTVTPQQVLGDERPGLSVGVSGDTRPTEALREFFKGCDCLVFDSTFGDELKERAVETRHSTAGEAGKLASRAGVKRLVLTHFSNRYDDVNDLVIQAMQHHGNVTAAHDLMRLML